MATGINPSQINPGAWAQFNASSKLQLQTFLLQLSQFALGVLQFLTPTGIAGLLNGSGLLLGASLGSSTIGASSLKAVGFNLNAATNQTVPATGAASVLGLFQFSAAVTLTFTNLDLGTSVTFRILNTTAGALVFKLAASNPASGAYFVLGKLGGLPSVNLTTTGVSVPANASFYFSGLSGTESGPVLVLVMT